MRFPSAAPASDIVRTTLRCGALGAPVLYLNPPASRPESKNPASIVAVRRRRLFRYRATQPKLRPMLEVIHFPVNYWRFMEILGQRGRISGPLKPGGRPGILASNLPITHGPR